MMKRLGFIVVALVALVSCLRWCPGEFRERWIDGYYTGQLMLRRVTMPNAFVDYDRYDRIELMMREGAENKLLLSGDALYDEISVRNGDLSYNKSTQGHRVPAGKRCMPRMDFNYAFADNFTRMHVTSDADWDEAHPAGTPLDDVLKLCFISYGAFVRNGYISIGTNVYETLISELTPSQMEIVATEPRPYIPLPKLDREHTLTVEWTTTEGEVKRASVVCEPKQ